MITKDIARVYDYYGSRYFGTPPTVHGPGTHYLSCTLSDISGVGKPYKHGRAWSRNWTIDPPNGIIGTTPLGFI